MYNLYIEHEHLSLSSTSFSLRSGPRQGRGGEGGEGNAKDFKQKYILAITELSQICLCLLALDLLACLFELVLAFGKVPKTSVFFFLLSLLLRPMLKMELKIGLCAQIYVD